MKAIITLALKDLLLLTRDKAALFWVIGFPLIMALFFGSIFSSSGEGTSKLRVAVIDKDKSENSQLFIDELKNSDALRISTTTLDSARNKVRRGKLTAYLLIEEGFGNSNPFFTDSSVGGIEIGIDPARKTEAGYLQGIIAKASFKPLQEMFSNPIKAKKMLQESMDEIDDQVIAENPELKHLKNMMSSLDQFFGQVDTTELAANSPMQGPDIKVVEVATISEGPRSSWEITFPQALLWALIGCASTFAVSIVVERTRGTFLRLRLAPISRMQILLGKGAACFLACIVVMALLLTLGKLVFGIRIISPFGLVSAVLASAVCFVGVMMVISVLGKTEQAVGGGGMAILLIFAMSGGGMIPLMVMPSWMQTVSSFSPAKWSIVAAEGAIWRGFSFSEMLLPTIILLSIGIIGFTIGATILSRADD